MEVEIGDNFFMYFSKSLLRFYLLIKRRSIRYAASYFHVYVLLLLMF